MADNIKTKSPPSVTVQNTKLTKNTEAINLLVQNKSNSVMTVQQASEYLGLAVSTLNKWRCQGGGPVFIKMGRAVRYRIEDLEKYVITKKRIFTE